MKWKIEFHSKAYLSKKKMNWKWKGTRHEKAELEAMELSIFWTFPNKD